MNIYAEKIKRFYVSSYMMIVLLMLNEIQKKNKDEEKNNRTIFLAFWSAILCLFFVVLIQTKNCRTS